MSVVWGLAPCFFGDWRVAKGRAKMTKRREKRAYGERLQIVHLKITERLQKVHYRRDQVD